MNTNAKIYVAGHRGLAGSAIARSLQAAGYRNLLLRTHAELDLVEQAAVRTFFQRERPEVVFLAAARVGGILANSTLPAQFIHDNLAVQTNVIHEAWRAGVERLVFLGSSCIYPRECQQPMKEEHFLTGPLEPTNEAYATAKIAGVQMCWAYNRQYGTKYLCAMPTNLFGPGDNYDPQTSHVLAALIRRFHEAKQSGAGTVTLWGSGKPTREHLYSDDLGDACVFLAQGKADGLISAKRPPLVNVGTGEEYSVAELAEKVRVVVGSNARIAYDASKPDGMPRKIMDVSRLAGLGWRAKVSLEEGLRRAYASFLEQGTTCRLPT